MVWSLLTRSSGRRAFAEASQMLHCAGDLWEIAGDECWVRHTLRSNPPAILAFEVLAKSPVAIAVHVRGPGGTGEIALDFGEVRSAATLGIYLGASAGFTSFRLVPRGCRGRLRIRVKRFAAAEAFVRRAVLGGERAGDAAALWRLLGVPGAGCPPVSRGSWFRRGRMAGLTVRATELGARLHASRSVRSGATDGPLFSFIAPTFDTPPAYLDDLLRSFRSQRPGSAELVLSDDGSTSAATLAWLDSHDGDGDVRVVRDPERRGIAAATNAGVEVARGAFVGFIDHDDALMPFATDVLAQALELRPDAQLLYTDEVIADARLSPTDVFLKPAFDPVLLTGVNYINHLSVYRTERLRSIGALREGFEGSQDYELLLRYTKGLAASAVVHVPFPAYLWRRHARSFSSKSLDAATSAARRALQMHSFFPGRTVAVEPAAEPSLHRLRFGDAGGGQPAVSVIIPSRERLELISRVVEDLRRRTDYPPVEIVIVDNGSSSAEVAAFYEDLTRRDADAKVIRDGGAFNFSRLINRGVAAASGDLLLLLNNDIEVQHPGWLREMVDCLAFDRVGVVGARLLYPGGKLQHAGVIVGLGGYAGHWHVGSPSGAAGPMNRLKLRQTLSAVTGACMLVTRECWDAAGPLDETRFAVAYNDIDFCLRAGQRGYKVVWTPNATLLHHESASRGSDESPQNIARFNREKAHLLDRHGTDRLQDPAFNPWYSRDRAAPKLVLLDHIPAPR